MLHKKTIPTRCQMALLPVLMALLLARCDAATAAEAAPGAQHNIEQPAQPVADSLMAIARQTDTSVLFDAATVHGRVAHAVSGHLSAYEAITAALQGTGLVAVSVNDGTAVVVRAAPAPASAVPASAASATVPAAAATRDGAAHLAAQESGEGGATPTSQATSADGEVVKVEITGSRLKRVEAEGPAPVNVYTAKDIEQSGQPTHWSGFLAGLNEVSASAGEGGLSTLLGQSSVQLRGLPLGSTLVLINGRRMEAVGSSSANYFNLNLIPMAAIERVEIVPEGSSAVYGGDALAGVVNVILKKSIDGVSLEANLGAGRGLGDGGLSLATGGHDESGSFMVLGAFSSGHAAIRVAAGFLRERRLPSLRRRGRSLAQLHARHRQQRLRRQSAGPEFEFRGHSGTPRGTGAAGVRLRRDRGHCQPVRSLRQRRGLSARLR